MECLKERERGWTKAAKVPLKDVYSSLLIGDVYQEVPMVHQSKSRNVCNSQGKAWNPIASRVRAKDPRPLFGDMDYCDKERLRRQNPHKDPVEWQCGCPACKTEAPPRPTKGTNGGVGKHSVVSEVAYTSLLTTPRPLRCHKARLDEEGRPVEKPRRGRSVGSQQSVGRERYPAIRREHEEHYTERPIEGTVQLDDDVFKITYKNGDVYHGQVHNNMRNGNGITVYACGGTLSCWWVDDRPNGYGERTWPDGSVFEGVWRDGKPSGQGRMKYSDGGIYHGMWYNGSRDGQGEVYDPVSGTVLLGFWENDQQLSITYKITSDGTAHIYDSGSYIPARIPVFSKILEGQKQATSTPTPAPRTPAASSSPPAVSTPSISSSSESFVSPAREKHTPLAMGRSRSAPQMQYLADCASEMSVSPVPVDEYVYILQGGDQSSCDTPSEHKLDLDAMSGSPKMSPSPRYSRSQQQVTPRRASYSPEGLTPGYSSNASPEYYDHSRVRSY